jgi:hypothetical protein
LQDVYRLGGYVGDVRSNVKCHRESSTEDFGENLRLLQVLWKYPWTVHHLSTNKRKSRRNHPRVAWPFAGRHFD